MPASYHSVILLVGMEYWNNGIMGMWLVLVSVVMVSVVVVKSQKVGRMRCSVAQRRYLRSLTFCKEFLGVIIVNKV